MAQFRENPKGFATKAIHVAQEPENWTYMPVIPPIVTTTTFKQPAPAEPIVNIHIFLSLIEFSKKVLREGGRLPIFIKGRGGKRKLEFVKDVNRRFQETPNLNVRNNEPKKIYSQNQSS